MKLSGILVVVCVASWGLGTVVLSPGAAAAAFLGMAAPLALGVATVVLVEQTARTDIQRLTARLTGAFIAKMVFYPVYVLVVISVLAIDPVPFVISFALYFVGLHITEALHFKTLFAKTTRLTTANQWH